MKIDEDMCVKHTKLHKLISGTAAALFLLLLFLTVPFIRNASAKYVSEFKQNADLVVNPTKPVLAKGSSWYSGTTDKSFITQIIFAENDYSLSPDESDSLIETFYADVNNKGTVKCYVVETASGPAVVISGNGWDDGAWNDDCNTVYANADASSMFSGFSSLIEIKGIERLNTKDSTTFVQMFLNCGKLERIPGLSAWNVDKVSSMKAMFSGCGSLQELSLSSWHPGQQLKSTGTFSIYDMFKNCGSLKSIDFSGWVMPDAKIDMGFSFAGCSSLEILDLSDWNVRTTTLWQTFMNCNKVREIDLSGFDTSSVTNTQYCFQNCYELETIRVSEKFNLDNVTSEKSINMFAGCKKLVGGHGMTLAEGAKYNTSNNEHITVKYAITDTTNAPGYFTGDTVTITYHANGGEGDDYEQYVLPNRDDYLADTSFAMRGHHITGWSKDTEGAADYTVNSGGKTYASFTEDTDLYAVWAPDNYTVSFDAKGGTVSPSSITVTFGSPYGELPVPERAGYTFTGWGSDSSMPEGYREAEAVKNNGQLYIDTGIIPKVSKQTKVELSFKLPSGGSGVVQSIGANENLNMYSAGGSYFRICGHDKVKQIDSLWHTLVLQQNTSGRLFELDGAAGSGSFNEKNNTFYLFAMNGGGTNFYGEYSIAYCKIWDEGKLVRDFVPAVWRGGNTKYSQNGIEMTASLAADTVGLYDMLNNVFYIKSGSGTLVTEGAVGDISDTVYADDIVDEASDQSFVAHWSPNTYKLTLKYQDGVTSDAAFDVTNDDLYRMLPELSRPGYVFDGWFDSEDGGTQIHCDDIIYLTANSTFYAHWTKCAYNVSFDPGSEGTVSVSSKTVRFDEQYGDLPVPVREGYKFKGWTASRTPDGYLETEYTASTGKEYVNVGIIPSVAKKTKIEFKFRLEKISDIAYQSMGANRNLNMYGSGNFRLCGVDDVMAADTEWHTVILEQTASGRLADIDGKKITGSALDDAYDFYIFAMNGGSQIYAGKYCLSYFKLWENDILVRDFIPCYSKEKDEYGFYDRAGEAFYGNVSGSGRLTGTAVVIDEVFVTEETFVSQPFDHILYAVWEKTE